MVKSFMTNMPDQCGAFLAASRIIERHQGNIVRVSYNKAVDAHALFLDVEAEDTVLSAIEGELNQAGFLKSAREDYSGAVRRAGSSGRGRADSGSAEPPSRQHLLYFQPVE